ncbi:hypothetical protein EON83_20710 [bacterium]|nr:MAG: hypothetical protein EON83_20710 [bacterium]
MSELSYEQRKQALIDEITAAFDGVSREGGVSYTEARMLDDKGPFATVEGLAEARRQDTETRWQDVPEDDIGLGAGHSNLSFLDPIGFRYYIPAYIVWYLRYMDEEDPQSPYCDSNTFGSVISALKLHGGKEWEEYTLTRFRLFTAKQRKAIAHFLEFDATRRVDLSRNSAQEALRSYWRQFL